MTDPMPESHAREAESPPLSPAEVAKLRAGLEAAQFELVLLRRETARLSSINRALDGRLRVAEGERGVSERERERLRLWSEAVEHSIAWRCIQAIRGLFGRRW